MSDEPVIHVVTAVIRDAAGALLLVRKRGTHVFMQPGGKREAGETDVAALVRELTEEIGVVVNPARLHRLGTYRSAAANERDCLVEATIFAVDGPVNAHASGEIEELWWRADDDPNDRQIAPLTRDHVIGRM